MKSTNARIRNVFITYYSLVTCFDRRRHHPQGDLEDYKKSRQTVGIRRRTARCYELCHVRLPVHVEQLGCHWTDFHEIWYLSKKRVKVTLVQALRLCTGRTVHRGSRGIALLFYDHGTRRGWGVSVTPRPRFTPRKDPVPIVQEAGWVPGAGLERCGKSRPHRDSIPGPSSP